MELTLAEIVAHNLRRRRKELGLTQTKLAEKTGIGTSYVSMLENGQRTPPLDTLHALARALRVEVGALLTPPRRRTP